MKRFLVAAVFMATALVAIVFIFTRWVVETLIESIVGIFD